MFTNRELRMAVGVGALVLACCALRGFAAEETAEKALPLGKIVMFNSGVGFFEHRGEVDGDPKVDLKFNVDDINDLLKSMVLEDQGGGRISTITYGSRDPITKTLKTFSIDLTRQPTIGRSARGRSAARRC